MSAANSEITLTELERLIKLLGLLASTHDGEVLNAARLAQRWVADKGTSWEALLVPEPLPLPVVGVAAPKDPDRVAEAHDRDRAQAFQNGYQAGLRAMAAQLKAQAQMSQGYGNPWMGSTMASGAPQSPVHGQTTQTVPRQGVGAQAPVAASGGPVRAWPAGSWQAVAQALLDRHAQGIPGVLRSREEAFVSDILQRGFPTLTTAQEDWLRAIAARSAMNW